MREDEAALSSGDTAGDHGDTARDHSTKDVDRSQELGSEDQKKFAKNHPDPLGDGLLQVWPIRKLSEFDSTDDFFAWLEAFDRWKEGLPPPRPVPDADEYEARVPAPQGAAGRRAHKPRQIGVRLTDADFGLLTELARAHSVRPGTMAGILVARGVRAAAENSAGEE